MLLGYARVSTADQNPDHQVRGRFPRAATELTDDAVAHLALQVRTPAGDLASFGASAADQASASEAEADAGQLLGNQPESPGRGLVPGGRGCVDQTGIAPALAGTVGPEV